MLRARSPSRSSRSQINPISPNPATSVTTVPRTEPAARMTATLPLEIGFAARAAAKFVRSVASSVAIALSIAVISRRSSLRAPAGGAASTANSRSTCARNASTSARAGAEFATSCRSWASFVRVCAAARAESARVNASSPSASRTLDSASNAAERNSAAASSDAFAVRAISVNARASSNATIPAIASEPSKTSGSATSSSTRSRMRSFTACTADAIRPPLPSHDNHRAIKPNTITAFTENLHVRAFEPIVRITTSDIAPATAVEKVKQSRRSRLLHR